jgi:AraC-like DNA-binding protein
MSSFTKISNGRERWSPYAHIGRHRHDRAYAALILSGSYEESGSRGRFRVSPGDILFHEAFDAHLDRFCRSGAQILNLLVEGFSPGMSIGHIADPDTVVRLAERNTEEAVAQLRVQLRPIERVYYEWQDVLAADLLEDPRLSLDGWAWNHDLAPATVSRGFRKVFGLTPAEFRLETRTHRALKMIAANEAPLASIAAMAGFADQAHMSRAIRLLTGATPGSWRRSNQFKTAALPCGPNHGHESCN